MALMMPSVVFKGIFCRELQFASVPCRQQIVAATAIDVFNVVFEVYRPGRQLERRHVVQAVTGGEAQPWAEAVAVKGHKIVYVGNKKGAKAFVGEGTERIDLAGKMLLPGFFSAHEHLIASGWMGLGAQLGDGKSKGRLSENR